MGLHPTVWLALLCRLVWNRRPRQPSQGRSFAQWTSSRPHACLALEVDMSVQTLGPA